MEVPISIQISDIERQCWVNYFWSPILDNEKAVQQHLPIVNLLAGLRCNNTREHIVTTL